METFEWNTEQKQAFTCLRSGKSFVLNGAAGTGKTTSEKEMVRVLISENLVPMIDLSTKYLERGKPGIVITSFTRRAVRNSRKVVSEEVKSHCITLHKLLEFEPVFYEVYDEEAKKNRVTMRFEPQRNSLRKLPDTLRVVIIDEASMPSTELFFQLLAALPDPSKVQFIFVGDLYQLPPVYGQAILGFKLLELPVIELTHIYRQAKNSPIISLAHQIKNGEEIPFAITNGSNRRVTETEQGKVTLHAWKKPLSDFDATHTMGLFLKELVKNGHFDPEEDVILCPQEKVKNLAFGTNEFNRVVAQQLGEQREAEVFEVIAGFQRHYYAVGDRVMVGREDATITKITKNARYWSTVRPRPASKFLDRWGSYKQKPVETGADEADFDVDKFLDQFTLKGNEEEDRKQEASHIIEVELLDSGICEAVSSAGDVNAMQFAYCLTVHKAQGSEWTRVFFLTHQSHVTMWSRELLYTAVTRARKELYMIIEPDRPGKLGTLSKAAASPRIKGDTLEEKAEFFKGKKEAFDARVDAISALPQGKAVAGVYQGKKVSGAVQPIAPAAAPVKLVRLHELVSAAFRAQAQDFLQMQWKKAEGIWGTRIGAAPTLDFNLQRSQIVGLAKLQARIVLLNPVWCILAEEIPDIRDKMLGEVLTHELCHIIAWTFSSDRGHDSGWRMAMKLMGLEPFVFANEADNKLPSWAKSYQEVMQKKLLELKEKHNAVISDDYSHHDMDEV